MSPGLRREITAEQRAEAWNRRNKNPRIEYRETSIEKNNEAAPAAYIGKLGEIIVRDAFPGAYEVSDFNFDLMIQGRRVEVKTKRSKYTPREYYRFSVAASSAFQNCDVYCFVSILYDATFAFIMGFISRERFYGTAVFHKAGEPDFGDFTFRADCWNVTAEELDFSGFICPGEFWYLNPLPPSFKK